MFNSTKGRRERIGKIYQMHANKREERPSAIAGQISGRHGAQGHQHRRHAQRPEQPGDPGVDDVPGAGHQRGDRAEDQGGPGQARHRHPAAGRGGPDLPGPDRRGDRPDHHLRDGRAPPRGAGRADEARVRVEANIGRPQVAYRETVTPEGGEGRVHPQEADRRLRPVRAGGHQPGADRRRRRRLRVREQDHRWAHPARVHPVGRHQLPGGGASSACWPGTRWST